MCILEKKSYKNAKPVDSSGYFKVEAGFGLILEIVSDPHIKEYNELSFHERQDIVLCIKKNVNLQGNSYLASTVHITPRINHFSKRIFTHKLY